MSPTIEELLDDVQGRPPGGVPVEVDGEIGEFSLVRAILGDGAFEARVCDAVAASIEGAVQSHGGTFLPPETVFPRAALDAETTTEGEELVFERRPELVGAQRPVPRVERLGAMILRGGSGTVRLVRVTSGNEVAWVPEVPGDPVTDEDIEVEGETLELSHGMLSTAYSRQLKRVNPETDDLVETELRAAAAQAVDEGAVAGAGGDEPTGLLNRSDVPTHSISDPDGGAPAYTDVTAIEETPAAADVDEIAPGWLTTPGVRRTLRETAVLAADGAGPVWRGGRVLGRRGEVSSAVPSDLTKGAGTDLHGLLFSADWSNLVVHILAVEIVPDRYRLKKQGVVEATLFVHVGVGLRHPEAFVRVLDVDVS